MSPAWTSNPWKQLPIHNHHANTQLARRTWGEASRDTPSCDHTQSEPDAAASVQPLQHKPVSALLETHTCLNPKQSRIHVKSEERSRDTAESQRRLLRILFAKDYWDQGLQQRR